MRANYVQLALFVLGRTWIWYEGKVRFVEYQIDWQGNFKVLRVLNEQGG